MTQYAHQPVIYCVCLLFGAEQAVQWVYRPFLWKQLPAAADKDTIRTVTANQNSKVVAWTA